MEGRERTLADAPFGDGDKAANQACSIKSITAFRRGQRMAR